jgi:hypothetical protein
VDEFTEPAENRFAFERGQGRHGLSLRKIAFYNGLPLDVHPLSPRPGMERRGKGLGQCLQPMKQRCHGHREAIVTPMNARMTAPANQSKHRSSNVGGCWEDDIALSRKHGVNVYENFFLSNLHTR